MKLVENPTLVLMHVLGWSGGTIHQVAEATGLTVEQILHLNEVKPDTAMGSEQSSGWFAVRTCDLAYNKATIFPKYQGNVDFWYGAMRGQWMKEQGA